LEILDRVTAMKNIAEPLMPINGAIPARSVSVRSDQKGQALVEYTLAFILLLIIAWIPADFGLAFYTGQMAMNASREGARIAAAQRILAAGTCNLPCASEQTSDPNGVLAQTAKRVASALLTGAIITVTIVDVAPCNRMVTVAVLGSYNYFFYRILRLMTGSTASAPGAVTIDRKTSMRWEHQC
jgi:Flp pilus assembly protein TadG